MLIEEGVPELAAWIVVLGQLSELGHSGVEPRDVGCLGVEQLAPVRAGTKGQQQLLDFAGNGLYRFGPAMPGKVQREGVVPVAGTEPKVIGRNSTEFRRGSARGRSRSRFRANG